MVATTGRYCWKYIYISADNVPLPIFVHLLHGYSQNCYSVGIEFPLNLNLDFPCNPVDEISAFFTRYSPKKSSWVRWWNILRVASQNIEQFISDKWKNLKTAWGSMHIFCSLENGVELCTNLQIGNCVGGCWLFWCGFPTSLWIYHTLWLGHNNSPSRNWRRGEILLKNAFYSPMVLSLVSRKTPMISPTAHFLP